MKFNNTRIEVSIPNFFSPTPVHCNSLWAVGVGEFHSKYILDTSNRSASPAPLLLNAANVSPFSFRSPFKSLPGNSITTIASRITRIQIQFAGKAEAAQPASHRTIKWIVRSGSVGCIKPMVFRNSFYRGEGKQRHGRWKRRRLTSAVKLVAKLQGRNEPAAATKISTQHRLLDSARTTL